MAVPSSETVFRFRDVPRAIWYFLAEDRRRYLVFLGFLAVALAYDLVPPVLIGSIANFLVEWKEGADLVPLGVLIVTLAVSSGAVAILRLMSKRQLSRAAINARYRAKVQGFRRLVDFSLVWHQGESAGNKAQRIITGSEALREWTGDFANQILPTVITFFGTLAACVFLTPWFALFFVWYLGVLGAIEYVFDRQISKLSDTINLSQENASGTFVEGASNILAVQALGAGDQLTGRVSAREESARTLSHQRIKLGTKKWMFFQVHNALSWGIFLVMVAWMVMTGHLGAGFVLTYTMYFANLRNQATEFTDRFQTMIERKSNLARMMPYFWQDHALDRGTEAFPKQWDALVLNDVRFRYGEKAALAGLNLVLPRGSWTGIAGASGSGKSTLIKVLLGLYRIESGTLTVGKTPLAAVASDELTAHVSVVLQETELFNFTLRDNLTMMRNVDPALLAEAIRIADLDALIANLPAGLDTLLGEKGYSLSGGERQRVGIARAVCRDAPILLLDEATSALDSATEQRVMAGLLGPWARGRTLVIVAHRVSTLAATDRILVFEAGALVEEGKYADLVADPTTRFGALHRLQS